MLPRALKDNIRAIAESIIGESKYAGSQVVRCTVEVKIKIFNALCNTLYAGAMWAS